VEAVYAVLGLVMLVAATAALARRLRLLAPILLVVVGLAFSFIPGIPDYRLDPDIALTLFLPPLLFAAAVQTSLPAFRSNLRPIGLLAIGLVLFTTLAVGLVAQLAIPGLPPAAAYALGAIVAPPDAVSATAVARRTGLPRRLVVVLEGESLVNDATALVTYRVAVAAAVSGSVSVGSVGASIALASVGGLAVGVAATVLVSWLHARTDDPLLDNTTSLLTPFIAYLPAERIHASGVIAVVTAGLWLGHRAPVRRSAVSRLQAEALWRMIEFLLQGVVFMLIGLQLRATLHGVRASSWSAVATAAAAVVVTVVVARFVWVFPATYLARLIPRVRARDPAPPWQYPTVLAWSGMRGVVSLAAAIALPLNIRSGAPFPSRDLIVLLAFVVIVVTLVLQGVTLPWLIRRLGLPPPDPVRDALQEAESQHQAARAALVRLDEALADGSDAPPDGVAERLRILAEARANAAWERLGHGGGASVTTVVAASAPPDQAEGLLEEHAGDVADRVVETRRNGRRSEAETPSSAYRRLRLVMLQAEREEFVARRDRGELDEEVLLRVLRELDLEEAMLGRE